MVRLELVVITLACMLPAGSARAQQATPPPMTGVTITGDYGAHLPIDISQDGHKIDNLIHVMHIFMAILFVGWGAFFAYCLVQYRARPAHVANSVLGKAKASKYSEIAVAIFEAVLLFGFAIPVWGRVKSDIPTDDPIRVRVLGEQFAWNFHYPGADGQFGLIDPKAVDAATNPMGLVRDGHGKDDVVSGEFHVPVGRPVVADITSKDVIHSFFVPVLRVKQDAVPGMRVPIWFRTKPNTMGTYEVACAQLCGNNHYSMKALMYVDTDERFKKWMEEKSAPPKEFDE